MHKLGRLGEQVVERIEQKLTVVQPGDPDIDEHVLSTRGKTRSVFRDEFKNSPENGIARRQLLTILKNDYDFIIAEILKRNVRMIPKWEDFAAFITDEVLDYTNGNKAFYNPHLILFPNDISHENWTVKIIHSQNSTYYELFSWSVKGSKT